MSVSASCGCCILFARLGFVSISASCGCSILFAPIAFSASLTSDISRLGVEQEIIFDQVHLNVGNNYDVRHGNFRAPVDGTYEFTVSMLAPGGKWAGVEIVKVCHHVICNNAKICNTNCGVNINCAMTKVGLIGTIFESLDGGYSLEKMAISL